MIFLPLLLAAAAQKADKLPPANPLPPPISEEEQVMAPLNAWFAGIDAADPTAIRAQLRMDGGGGATVAATNADGSKVVRHMSWEEYLAKVKPGEHRYHEQFSGQPAIEIDGDIAMVWSPYVFLIDGKVHHCGVDHFGLARENGAWKIASLSWSARAIGCDAR
jgi:hypothetical protein